jgi:hypothetical protein
MASKRKAPRIQVIPLPPSVHGGSIDGGRFRISGLTNGAIIYVDFVWQSTPHGLKPTKMAVTTRDGIPITSDLLREIPIGRILRIAEVRALKSPCRPFKRRKSAPVATKRGSRLPEGLLERVADLWIEAGDKEVKSRDRYVAVQLDITHSKARQRVYQCRQRGLLPYRS